MGATISAVSPHTFFHMPARAKGVPDRFDQHETLLDDERKMAVLFPGVSTITFLEAEVTPEGTDAGFQKLLEAFLQNKVDDIVEKNPWLTSFVGFPKVDTMCMCYSNQGRPERNHLEVVEEPSLQRDLPYIDVMKKLSKYGVQKCVIGDSEDQLFKVTLVKMRGSEAALVFSVSHIIGDGATFYSLYKMLDASEPVVALDPRRKLAFDDQDLGMALAQSDTIRSWYHSSLPYVGTIARSLYLRARTFVEDLAIGEFIQDTVVAPDEGIISRVNMEELNRLKQKYTQKAKTASGGNGFVSSNDIITSWYLSHISGVHSKGQESAGQVMATGRHAQMVVNFRGKMPLLTHELAGNYVGTLIFPANAGISPNDVRSALSKKPTEEPARAPSPPGLLDSLNPWTVVTNWAAFYTELRLPGKWKVKSHLPMFVHKVLLGTINICIIFNGGADNGLCVFATRGAFSGANGSISRLERTRRRSSKKLDLDDLIGQPLVTFDSCEYHPNTKMRIEKRKEVPPLGPSLQKTKLKAC